MNQKDILKLAGVKSESELYRKFRTHEEFLAKYGAKIKKANLGDKLLKPMQSIGMKQLPTQALDTKTLDPMKQQSGGFDLGSMFNPAKGIAEGIMGIVEEGKKRRKAEQWANVSGVVRQASQLQPEQQEREYLTPWDNITSGEEFANIYGTGTNVLAKNGKSLKKAKGGFEQMLNAGGADVFTKGTDALFQDNAGYNLGESVGSAVKLIPGVGPVVSAIAEPVLGTIGGLLDPNQKKIRRANATIERNLGMIGMQNNFGGVQQQYSSFMQTGGNIKENNMGGDLKVYDGKAETISYNPYLESETVMFKGPSHEDGGMPISYGNSPVEVEGGEPAVKMNNGGEEDSLVVFGNLKIPKDMLQDKSANGKKFKNYIADLSKVENKQNKIMENATKGVEDTIDNASFDKLKLSSLKANMLGVNMKLKDLANKKQDAANLQNAINETAEEHNLVADDLARGKIKTAAKGAVVKPLSDYGVANATSERVRQIQQELVDKGYGISVDGIWGMKTQQTLDSSMNENLTPIQSKGFSQLPIQNLNTKKLDVMMNPKGEQKEQDNKFPWMKAINSVIPYLRPSDAEALDPRQLAGEMYSLSNNQLEPVYAQTMQPELSIPQRISLGDQMTEVDNQVRAAIKAAGNNPAAQANIMAQALEAKNKIKGEEFRINQGEQSRTFEKNRDIVNQTKLQNLNILSQQQDKQFLAKSNTKTITQKALESVSNKYLQNQLQNRTLQTYENMYNYRYDDNGRLINMNAPYEFNTSGDNQRVDTRKAPIPKKKENGGLVRVFK